MSNKRDTSPSMDYFELRRRHDRFKQREQGAVPTRAAQESAGPANSGAPRAEHPATETVKPAAPAAPAAPIAEQPAAEPVQAAPAAQHMDDIPVQPVAPKMVFDAEELPDDIAEDEFSARTSPNAGNSGYAEDDDDYGDDDFDDDEEAVDDNPNPFDSFIHLFNGVKDRLNKRKAAKDAEEDEDEADDDPDEGDESAEEYPEDDEPAEKTSRLNLKSLFGRIRRAKDEDYPDFDEDDEDGEDFDDASAQDEEFSPMPIAAAEVHPPLDLRGEEIEAPAAQPDYSRGFRPEPAPEPSEKAAEDVVDDSFDSAIPVTPSFKEAHREAVDFGDMDYDDEDPDDDYSDDDYDDEDFDSEEPEDDDSPRKGAGALKKFISLFIVRDDEDEEEFDDEDDDGFDDEDDDGFDDEDFSDSNGEENADGEFAEDGYDFNSFVYRPDAEKHGEPELSAPRREVESPRGRTSVDYEGGPVMDDRNKISIDMTEQMASGLESRGMSRRERRELAERLAAEEAARRAAEAPAPVEETPLVADNIEDVSAGIVEIKETPSAEKLPYPDEPTREYKLVSPAADSDEDDEEDDEEEEEVKKPRKFSFLRGKKSSRPADDDDEDDEDDDLFDADDEDDDEDDYDDDEDEEEEVKKPRRGLFGKKSRKYDEDDEEDDDEYDDDEDDDYDDDDDEYDDYDDEDDDDDYDDDDEEGSSFGRYILGLFKALFGIIVFILVVILTLNILDYTNVFPLDSMFERHYSKMPGVFDTVFPFHSMKEYEQPTDTLQSIDPSDADLDAVVPTPEATLPAISADTDATTAPDGVAEPEATVEATTGANVG